MITHFKLFESENKFPEFLDYVSCDISDYTANRYLIEFISSNIGQISKIQESKTYNKNQMLYYVRYQNIPENIYTYFDKKGRTFDTEGNRLFILSNIKEFGKTKEEVEMKISAKKYNL